MISCNLKGGFGNILFQYAATLTFANKIGTEPNFPNFTNHIKFLNKNHPRNLQTQNYADEYRSVLLNINEKNTEIKNVYKFPFEYVDFDVPDFSLIDGYFQSEKYFKSNRKKIIDSINIKLPEKWNDFNFEDYTSIHIRRGDYLKLKDHHTVLSGTPYYIDAMNIIEEKNFLIFSDDINWCKKNLINGNFIFVQEKDYHEIKMMSLCKNNIIANSSFSWWGAWLNVNQNKKIIAPKKWFGPKINHKLHDLFPENWIKL